MGSFVGLSLALKQGFEQTGGAGPLMGIGSRLDQGELTLVFEEDGDLPRLVVA